VPRPFCDGLRGRFAKAAALLDEAAEDILCAAGSAPLHFANNTCHQHVKVLEQVGRRALWLSPVVVVVGSAIWQRRMGETREQS